MRVWYAKAAVQGALSVTRTPQRWNRILQKYVTGSLELTYERFEEKWQKCQEHLRSLSPDLASIDRRTSVLELGTGWHPIVPIGLALSGFEQVRSVDVEKLHDRKAVADVIETFAARQHELLVPERVDRAVRLARTPGSSAMELLRSVGVEPLIADARRLPLTDGAVDLFISNNTFEHIPRQMLGEILREFHRVAAPGAVMSHHIDLADHYANFDPGITPLNFLRFSERTWKLFNNRLQYQNRLQLSDYLALHREAGWRVTEHDAQRESPEALESLPLAPEFRDYDEDDLLVCEAWVRSRRSESVESN